MSDAVIVTFDVLRRRAGDTADLDEALEPVTESFGWTEVCAAIFKALESNEEALWYPAAAAIWGAVLDKRELDPDRAIALVYFRLNSNSTEEENLAWSIASRLKGVGYLSSYDPRSDPQVQKHLDQLAIQ